MAILLVLLFHGLLNSDTAGHARLSTLSAISGRTGALGVLIFFCISGYLITQRLVAESRRNGKLSLRAFYIKRAFRILPPLVAYLLVIVALSLCGVIALRRGDWGAPIFLSNYMKGSWYTTQFWSLSVEEHFYLFWPVYIVLVGWRKAMVGGIAIIVAVAVWRPYELRYIAAHHIGTTAKYLQHTDMRIDYIMMGSVVALAVAFYPWATTALKRVGTGYGLSALFVLLLVCTRPFPVDLRSVQALILTLMVCGSAMADAPVPRLLLTNRPILFLGKISYSLYIWQQLFLGRTQSNFWNSLWALPIKYAAALGMAYVSYRFLERPFIQYGRRLLAEKALPMQAGVTRAA